MGKTEFHLVTGHLLSQNEVSIPEIRLHLIELLAEAFSLESTNNPDCFQDCSLQPDGKVLSLKKIPTQLTEHGDIELWPTYFIPMFWRL